MGGQSTAERFGRTVHGIIEPDPSQPCGRQRRRDGRTDPAAADDQCVRADQVASLVANAADETLAVEHVGEKRSVLPLQQGIGRAGNSRRRAHLVRELDRGLLVGHRHQRATDVGHFEQLSEEGRIVGTLNPHRHYHRVDAGLLEKGVVDHRRLERLGRVTEMGDQRRPARDHSRPPSALDNETSVAHRRAQKKPRAISSHSPER